MIRLLACALFATLFPQPAPAQSTIDESGVKIARPLQALGIYRVESMWRIVNGKVIKSPIDPFDYLVFSDGKRIGIALTEHPLKRVYYSVYQAGTRIYSTDKKKQVRSVEGMLASSNRGGSLRQILLTPEKLRITSMPPNSEDIVVIEARKIADEPALDEPALDETSVDETS